MEYRRLGRSGLQVSALSFGSWVTFHNQFQTDMADTLMSMAYEAGVNFFDNAEAYAGGQSEEIMGQVLKKKNWGRDTYVVSSKVFWGGKLPNQRGLSRKHVVEACHAALKRLQVDYLDLYFCHRPDHNTPIEETCRAMHDLITQGKVLYWGTSEWSAQELLEAHAVCQKLGLIGPTMEQPQYNMFHRQRFEAEYERLYKVMGLGTTIWSPLASGVLTGKYNNGIPEGSRLSMADYGWLRDAALSEDRLQKVKQLAGLSASLDVTLPALAIAWCLKNPNVSSVILGASSAAQLTQNLKALDAMAVLTEERMTAIENILKNAPTKNAVWE